MGLHACGGDRKGPQNLSLLRSATSPLEEQIAETIVHSTAQINDIGEIFAITTLTLGLVRKYTRK